MSPERIHLLLQRQLERLQLDPDGPPPDPESWQQLLERVSCAYADGDQENYLLERALSISNQEMQVLYDEVRDSLTTSVSKAKEAARISDAQLLAVLDTVGEGIVTVKQNGLIMHGNAEACAMWGYSADEFINMEAVLLLHKPHREEVRKRLREFTRVGGFDFLSERHSMYGVRKNGTMFPLEAKFTETRVGDMLFFTVAAHDISQRVDAQKKLVTQMRRHESILQQAADGFCMHNMQGQLFDVNKSLCSLSGYSRQELVSKTVFDLYDMDPKELVIILDELRAVGEKRFTAELRRVQGDSVKVEVSARCGEHEGDEFYSAFLRDLSESEKSKEREAELQAKLARSERMESLGVLAGGVAHDLNNILGPLVAYPDLLAEDLPADDGCLDMIHEMGSSARRAAAVIQDLLALARRGNYNKVPLNLNDVVSQYLDSPPFRACQEANPNAVAKTTLDAELLPILGSHPHLTQVVMNLVANGFEAIADEGSVTVQTQCRYLDRPVGGYDTIEVGDYAVLRVSDTGSGIDPENLERIFEPFYTRKMLGRNGTGLGLAVVYGVVKDLDGYIDVKSTVGVGTEFIIYFPVTHERIEEKSEGLTDIRGRERVLIVDDVEEQRNLATRLLRSLGYETESVSSGEDALAFLRVEDVDLVVMDMIMEGGIDGLITLERVRRFKPLQRCIIASGFAETDRVKEAVQLGIGDYVLKPYTLEKIGTAVRKELDRTDEPEPTALLSNPAAM